MATSSSESFLRFDSPPAPSYFESSLFFSEYQPRASASHDLYPALSLDFNRLPQHARQVDRSLPVRERPVSFCPNATSNWQQYGTLAPRTNRRFSDSNNPFPDQESNLSAPRHHQYDSRGSVHGGMAKDAARHPPVSYRQSWRNGTDFGLSRRTGDQNSEYEYECEYEGSSPESEKSTRLPNRAPSISEDGMSSVYECTASDFPKPPPIASPVIRRMRSSPWYMDESNSNLQNLSEQQKKIRMALDESLNHSLESRGFSRPSNGLSINQVDFSSNSHLLGPRSTRDSLKLTSSTSFVRDRDTLEWTGRICSPGTLPSSISEHPSHPRRPPRPLQQSASMSHTNIPSELPPEHSSNSNTRPLSRLPRIIRKVASMRSEAQKSEAPITQPVTGTVGRKFVPKSRSFRSILQSAQADRARERTSDMSGEWHRPTSWVLGNPSQVIDRPLFAGSDVKPSKRVAGKRSSKHQHLSVPAPKVYVNVGDTEMRRSGSDGALGAPFLHRPFGSSKKGGTIQEQCEGPNSFIDISPDKRGCDSKSGGKRDRVKGMIAKASNKMFGWGKQRPN